jgi:phosphoenolpyruvate synthase/pyruvate phosphate dikinase
MIDLIAIAYCHPDSSTNIALCTQMPSVRFTVNHKVDAAREQGEPSVSLAGARPNHASVHQ